MAYASIVGMSDAGAKTGIVFGIFTVGALVGAIPACEWYLPLKDRVTHLLSYNLAYIPDRFGRRASMFFGNAILV